MTPSRFWAFVLVVCVALVATATLAGGATTQAAFVDDELGDGSVTAATSFGGGGPPENRAYNDANGNGRYDSGEQTYTENQLENFNDPSANVVIPANIGKVQKNGGGVSITANSITSEARFQSNGGSVTLEATGGDIDLSDQRVQSNGGTIEIVSSANIDLSGTTLQSNGGNINFLSNDDVNLNGASLQANGGSLTAELGASSATLSVSEASLRDNTGNTLTYAPSGVSVQGNPKEGSVRADYFGVV